jgi:hypothetical protein
LFHLSTSGYEKAAASRSTNSSFGCFFTTYKIQEKLEKKKKFHLTEYTCETSECDQTETLLHLFRGSPFARTCWDIVCPQRTDNLSVLQSLEDMRPKIKLPFYMEITILAAWRI